MKTYKKIALVTLLSTAVFQAQAISFNDIVQIAQNNPKTTAAITVAYALGVKFNFERTGQYVTKKEEVITNNPGIQGYSSLETTEKEHTFMQKLGSFLFPFVYGLIAGN